MADEKPKPAGVPQKAFDLFAHVVRQFVKSLTDRWVAIVLIVAISVLCGIYLVRLPANDLKSFSLVPFFNVILAAPASTIASVGGWVVAGLVMAICTLVSYVQHARIKAQGEELTEHRNKEDPQRISAGDRPALEGYAKAAKDRHSGDAGSKKERS